MSQQQHEQDEILPVESGDEGESSLESRPPSEDERDDHDDNHAQARLRNQNHNGGQGPSQRQVCVCLTTIRSLKPTFKTSNLQQVAAAIIDNSKIVFIYCAIYHHVFCHWMCSLSHSVCHNDCKLHVHVLFISCIIMT